MLFVNILKAPYYDKMVGNATKNFADMIISEKMIEGAIKSGKFESANARNEQVSKRMKGRHM